MGARALKPWGSFVGWPDVLRAFKLRNRGCDVLRNLPDGWLYLAQEAERRGKLEDAATYLQAGVIREAYDRDTYEPPEEVQAMFAPSSTPES
jgi:hypothetical protein